MSEVSILIKAVDEATAVLKSVKDELSGVDEAGKKAGGPAGGLNNFNIKMAAMGKAVTSTGIQMSAMVTAPLAALATGIFAAATNLGNLADGLLDLREQTGLNTDSLQAYRLAAIEAGVAQDTIANSAILLQTKLTGAGEQSKAMSESLAAIGVSAVTADGQLKGMDNLLPDIIASLQGVENITERNTLAFDIFGRGAKDLLPILGLGAGALERLTEEADAMGMIMSEDALNSANNFRIAQGKLKAEFTAVANSLTLEFMPILISVAQYVKVNMVPQFVAFAEKVKNLGEWFGSLPQPVSNAILGFVGVLAALGPVLIVVGSLITALPQMAAGFAMVKASIMPMIGPAGVIAAAAMAYIHLSDVVNGYINGPAESMRESNELYIASQTRVRTSLTITTEAERQSAADRLSASKRLTEAMLELTKQRIGQLEAELIAFSELPWWKQIFGSFSANAAFAELEQARVELRQLGEEFKHVGTVIETVTSAPLANLSNGLDAMGQAVVTANLALPDFNSNLSGPKGTAEAANTASIEVDRLQEALAAYWLGLDAITLKNDLGVEGFDALEAQLALTKTAFESLVNIALSDGVISDDERTRLQLFTTDIGLLTEKIEALGRVSSTVKGLTIGGMVRAGEAQRDSIVGGPATGLDLADSSRLLAQSASQMTRAANDIRDSYVGTPIEEVKAVLVGGYESLTNWAKTEAAIALRDSVVGTPIQDLADASRLVARTAGEQTAAAKEIRDSIVGSAASLEDFVSVIVGGYQSRNPSQRYRQAIDERDSFVGTPVGDLGPTFAQMQANALAASDAILKGSTIQKDYNEATKEVVLVIPNFGVQVQATLETIQATQETFSSFNDFVVKEFGALGASILNLSNQIPFFGKAFNAGLQEITNQAGETIGFMFDPITALTSIFFDLIGQSKAFSELIRVVNVLMEPLIMAFDVLLPVIRGIGLVFGALYNALSTLVRVVTFGFVDLGQVDLAKLLGIDDIKGGKNTTPDASPLPGVTAPISTSSPSISRPEFDIGRLPTAVQFAVFTPLVETLDKLSIVVERLVDEGIKVQLQSNSSSATQRFRAA